MDQYIFAGTLGGRCNLYMLSPTRYSLIAGHFVERVRLAYTCLGAIFRVFNSKSASPWAPGSFIYVTHLSEAFVGLQRKDG
jgi:hypothetical protein